MNRDVTGSRPPTWRTLLVSLLLAAAVWAVFAWPLPRHVTTAIPCNAGKTGGGPALHHMEPGDHLQLLYHFWLFEDMLRGRTPWFGNIYEFNTGDDAARRETGAYYFPFSLVFAAGDALAGRAFGWNLAGLFSIWLALLITFHLLRRHDIDEPWAWAIALLSVALPYRWYCLLGGSPAGFAMCWPPLLFLGLDIAVREERWRGGALAGLAVLLCAWDDTHSFYFGLLFSPLLCLVALSLRGRLPAWPGGWLRIAGCLLPVAAGLALALVTTQNMTGSVDAAARGPRKLSETALSTPKPAGFFAWEDLGHTNHVYLGYALVALLVLGLLVVVWSAARDPRRRLPAAGFVLLLLGIAAILVLALGIYGPHGGYPFRAARRYIPRYDMIRQAGKIFTILPPLLAVAAAISIRELLDAFRPRQAGALVCAGLLAAGLAEYAAQFRVVLCPLVTDQPAYAAVARDAAERGEKPHALVLPLWPGDAHFTSVYQYYASLHRIRLVNGYRPFVPARYRHEIFGVFESANQGELSDAQLDDLLHRGVRTVILHEDLFPEKVSPVPVTFTLKNLLNHPRLSLVGHDGPVWAWRIERTPRPVAPVGTNWTQRFPSQRAAKQNGAPALDLAPGDKVVLPAPVFFHAGTIDLEQDAVALDPARDRGGIVLYGPRWRLGAGRYELAVDFASPQREGVLGHWNVECPEGAPLHRFPLHAGKAFVEQMTVAGAGTLMLIFEYERSAPLALRAVTIRRID